MLNHRWKQPASLWLVFVLNLVASPIWAQSITPATDGTGTIVTPIGNQIDITGGQRSADGHNLFHSLERFNLSQGQIANFLANPAVRNIFSRVVGGEASIIDGRLQVTGSQANLFLMNPAGILFGPHASLNVPAAFTATTANGIGFGNGWFNATGGNDYLQLGGHPEAFAFTMAQPGAIANLGHLSVGTGQNLTLLGGTVLNTGQLSAPGGQITIAAIPGSRMVRISQPGEVLSLVIQPPAIASQVPDWGLPMTTLPQLLTGGDLTGATGVVVNADGTIRLTSNNMTVPSGAGTAIASGMLNTTDLTNGATGGNVNVLGDRVAVVGATINAAGASGGGTVRIGGDYQGRGTVHNGDRTYVSHDSIINVDAVNRGNGGRAIVWADETTWFNGTITARGGMNGGNGGFVEVSGRENLAFQGEVDVSAPNGLAGSILFDPRDINIVAGGGANDDQLVDSIIRFDDGGTNDFQIGRLTLEGLTGNITLQANRDINLLVNNLIFTNAPGTTITFSAGRNFNGAGRNIIASGRNVSISGATVTIRNIETSVGIFDSNTGNGGTVTINSVGDINTGQISTGSQLSAGGNAGDGGNILLTSQTGSINTNGEQIATWSRVLGDGSTGNAGSVVLNSPQGSITTGGINAFSIVTGNATSSSRIGNGGNVRLNSGMNITTGIATQSQVNNGDAGNAGSIDITSTGGNIQIGNLNATSIVRGNGNTGNGGSVRISSPAGNIVFRLGQDVSLNTFSNVVGGGTSGNGGAITLNSRGNITTGGLIAFSGACTNASVCGSSAGVSQSGNGGNIQINSAEGRITASARLDTSTLFGAVPSGNAGNVNLTAQGIQIPGIDAEGGISGRGGNVNIETAQFFQATQRLTNVRMTGASISTYGGLGGGSIAIRHGGGLRNTPFVVGDASVNGTAGDLTSGTFTIPSLRSLAGSFALGNIRIITQDSTPLIDDRLPDSTAWHTETANQTEGYLREEATTPKPKTLEQIQTELKKIESAIAVKPALIYVFFYFSENQISEKTQLNVQEGTMSSPEFKGANKLQLLLVTSEGKPIAYPVPVDYKRVVEEAEKLYTTVSSESLVEQQEYWQPSLKLYQWLIQPLESELRKRSINNLVFVMPHRLRNLPLAVLYNGNSFVIENYSVGLIPNMSLTDTRYVNIQALKVMLAGISQSDSGNIPQVETEVAGIRKIWGEQNSQTLLNHHLTLDNLIKQQQFGIIHFATHGKFNAQFPDRSYLQLWKKDYLWFDQFRRLKLDIPLLVLSACETAIGNEEWEYGFAGLANRMGAKSVLSSLWDVSDTATAQLMLLFYRQLRRQPGVIKAEALRQAQLALLASSDTSAPYYWAGFTLVGNPW